MLRRLIIAVIVGLVAAGLANQLLCDAPNPTLANPMYCGQQQWLTACTAFFLGAGLTWLLMLRRVTREVKKNPPAPEAGPGDAGR